MSRNARPLRLCLIGLEVLAFILCIVLGVVACAAVVLATAGASAAEVGCRILQMYSRERVMTASACWIKRRYFLGGLFFGEYS